MLPGSASQQDVWHDGESQRFQPSGLWSRRQWSNLRPPLSAGNLEALEIERPACLPGVSLAAWRILTRGGLPLCIAPYLGTYAVCIPWYFL